MTLTVISIIAVIVVLAVLVLLLLGMRALNPGSRSDAHDDFDEEYEYDIEDDPGREEEAPPGRGRRPRKDISAKRGFLKRDRVDWDDDEEGLSDNDFWSSLNEEGPAQRPAQGRGRRYADGDGDYEDDDAYDDYGYDEPYGDGYEDREGPRTPAAGTDLRQGQGSHAAPAPGPHTNMMALADLGSRNDPQQSRAPAAGAEQGPSHTGPSQPEPSRPELSSLPSEQETRGLPAAGPLGEDNGPLSSGPWPSGPSVLPPRSEEPPSGPLSAPSNGPGSPYPGAAGDGLSGTPSPYGAPFDSGAHARPDHGGGGRPSPDPLDPNFRPAPSNTGSDMSSPIWSSMDTGAHQRPDPSVLRAPEPPAPGGPSSPGAPTDPTGIGGSAAPGAPSPYGGRGSAQPGTADPLGGYGAPFGQGHPAESAQRSPFDSQTHTRPEQGQTPLWANPNTSGAHARPGQGQPPWSGPEDTGAYTRPPQGQPPSWANPNDTGTHSQPGHETDPYGWQAPPYNNVPHTYPGQAQPPWGNPGDTANRPWDTGTHIRPTQETDPYGRPTPPYNNPHTPPAGLDTGASGVGWENPADAPHGGVPTGHPGGSYGTPGWGSGARIDGTVPPPSAQETDPYGRQVSPYASGAHARPGQGQPPWSGPEDTGAYTRPPQGQPPSWANPNDTGTHNRPGHETDPYGWQAPPYNNVPHTHPTPSGMPPWGASPDVGAPSTPTNVQGGYGAPGGPSPYSSGTHLNHPGPTGPPQGNLSQPGPGQSPGQYGPGELLDGGYPPAAPPQHSGPAQYEGWGSPAQPETTDPYPRDAYGQPLSPPEGYYEGNYDNGRYH